MRCLPRSPASRSCLRCLALALACAAAAPCARRTLRGRRSTRFAADSFTETDDGIDERRRQRQSAAPRRSSRRCRTAGCSFSAEQQDGLHQGQGRTSCSTPRPASRSPALRRPISRRCALNNRLRARHRGGARRPDAAGARSGQALRGGAGGVQVARRERAAGARRRARQGNRRARQARADRGARRRHPLSRPTPPRPTSSTRSA